MVTMPHLELQPDIFSAAAVAAVAGAVVSSVVCLGELAGDGMALVEYLHHLQ
jgi:hypothetical protein